MTATFPLHEPACIGKGECNANRRRALMRGASYFSGSSVTSKPLRVVWIRVGMNCTPA